MGGNNIPKEYHPGEPLGEGKKCPRKSETVYGKGTVDDPLIHWTWIVADNPAWREAHHDILRAKAKEYGGFPCIVLRAPCHDTVTRRDEITNTPVTLPADPHLTVFMGQDLEHCQVQGHIYVIADRGTPVAIASPHDRKIVHDGYKPVSTELWTFGKLPRQGSRNQWGDAGQRTARREREGRYAPSGRQGTTTGLYVPPTRRLPTAAGKARNVDAPWRDSQTPRASQPPAPPVVQIKDFAAVRSKQ